MALTEKDKHYIKQNAGVIPDAELAKTLKCTRRNIAYWRKQLGIPSPKSNKPVDIVAMTDTARISFFKDHLENNHFWAEIKKQLTDSEMDFYIAEWSALCVQFQDILASEKRQIHDLIMTQILDNRILTKVKFLEEETIIQMEKLEKFRSRNNTEDNKEAAEREDALGVLLIDISSQIKMIGNEHEKLNKQKGDLYTHLNARRKDRVNQIKDSKHNFFGIIEAIQQNDVRQAQARYDEAHALATDRLEEKWKTTKVIYPDGKKDYILKTGKSS